MDLHCTKIFNGRRGCSARCHMGVITEDPKEWVCHEYNFSLTKHNEHIPLKTYYLSGHDYLVDPFHQNRIPSSRKTTLHDYFGNFLIEIDFVPLSTGDDMHEGAWKLLERLLRLMPFA